MIYRALGQTGLQVSIIGFGAAPLGNEYGVINPTVGERAVHAAIEQGVNYFDTSPYYGRTLSETRLGHALRGYRNKVYLATKGGRYGVDGFDFSAQGLATSVEESLRRLQTDTIDVYQLHDIEFVDRRLIIDEALPALERLREQGKFRYIGITGYPLPLLREVGSVHPVDTILSYCHYNLMNTTLSSSLMLFAKQQNIAVINASALHMGILTDQGAPAWHPAPASVHGAACEAAALARDYGTNITTIALQFALQNEDVSTTLVGMGTESEVLDNLALVDTLPDGEALAKILAVIAPVKDVNWHTGLRENDEPNVVG